MSDFPKTAPDFSRPIEALKACHERIRAQCDTLRKLVEHMKDHGCDEQVRQAASGILRYFNTAARHHHRDDDDDDDDDEEEEEEEEEDLLPRMMVAATVGHGSHLTHLVADIATDHREMDRIWTELRPALQDVSAGESTPLDPLEVDHFAKLYGSHITLEEANLYPLAEMLLSREDVAKIGSSMAQRRALLTALPARFRCPSGGTSAGAARPGARRSGRRPLFA